MKISDSLITLRAPEPSDLDALFRHENAPESPDSTTVMAPVSRRMLERYIENYSADIDETGSLRFMIDLTETGETVGSVDIYDFSARDRRGFVAIFVEERYRRRGVASHALSLLSAYAFGPLGAHQLAAEVSAGNEPSRALFEKAGYKTCGRLRSWLRVGRSFIDVILYQKLN